MPIRLKLRNTSVANRRPSLDLINPGELFINRHKDNPGVYTRVSSTPTEALSDKIIKVGPTYIGPTYPQPKDETGADIDPGVGEQWYKNDTAEFFIWDGFTWVTVVSTGNGGATIEVTDTTVSLPPNGVGALDLDVSRSFLIVNATTDYPAIIRIYSNADYRTADLARAIGDPLPAEGIIAEVETEVGNLSFDLAPIATGVNLDNPQTNKVYLSVINRDVVSRAIEVKLSVVKINTSGFGLNAGNGHVIQDDGAGMPQRSNLNFAGLGWTLEDDPLTNATIVGVNLGGGAAEIVEVETGVIANNAAAFVDASLSKSFLLLAVEASVTSTVRIYGNSNYRTVDSGRAVGIAPANFENGLIADLDISNSNSELELAPFVVGANLEQPQTNTTPLTIINRSGSAASVIVRLKVVKLGTGGGSITVTNNVTTVNPATSLVFENATITNNGGGQATIQVNPNGASLPTYRRTTSFNADINSRYLVATNSGVLTAVLPFSPSNGAEVVFADAAGTDPNNPTGFGNNKLVVIPNNVHTIQGYDQLELDTENGSVALVFDSVVSRWTIVDGFISPYAAAELFSPVSINEEILSSDRILNESEEEYHFLNPGGVDRNVVLPVSMSVSRKFYILNSGNNDGNLNIRVGIAGVIQDTLVSLEDSVWLYNKNSNTWRRV